MIMEGKYTDMYRKFSDCIVKYRHLFLILIFLVQTALANYLAFVIRFDAAFSDNNVKIYLSYLPLLLLIRIAVFIREGLYKGLWRYASTDDLIKIIKSTTMGSILFLFSVHYLIGDTSYPKSIYILDWLLIIIISGGNRLFIRVFREYMFIEPMRKKILIVGAGDAGEMIVREMKSSNKFMYEPVGFIDDNAGRGAYHTRGANSGALPYDP